MPVIKKDQIKPITNGEKLIEIFPNLSLDMLHPCDLGINISDKECSSITCDECKKKYMDMPYNPQPREHSTAENTTVDYHE
jgi:hypothetical protein